MLRVGAVAGAAGIGIHWANLGLPAVTAAEARIDPESVRLRPEIEPLVRLLEETPRERLVEQVAARIHAGTSYRDVVAALLLAGVRNVQPRPSVGFKFHAVLVVQSVHLASQAAADSDRWLPIFWALDYFKDSQARDVREGDWTMQPVEESLVPSAASAADAFERAMDRWDESAADAAAAGLARHGQPANVFELMFRYGARDFRSIGHKAIFAANAHRTLGVIGWQHAEPVLRSLAYAMLQHEGGNPADRSDGADLPGRRNQRLIGGIDGSWVDGSSDRGATTALLSVLRSGTEEEACNAVVDALNRGVGAVTVWDALFAAASELLLRQPGIVALHAVTTTNALHYAFREAKLDETRRFVTLQNAAFLPLFRDAMGGRGRVADRRIDAVEPADPPSGDNAAAELMAEVSRDPIAAMRQVLGYLQANGDARRLADSAHRVLLHKGDDAHDFKYASALFEDYSLISPAWRDRCLATGALRWHGALDRENPLVERVRAAFA
ncbi:MAG: hypothetical protein ACOY3P_10000 [Planctomycetota bacterium]